MHKTLLDVIDGSLYIFALYLDGGYGDHNFFDLEDHVIEEILVNHSPAIASKFISQYHSKERSFINSEGESVVVCDYSSASDNLAKDALVADFQQELDFNTISDASNPENSFDAPSSPPDTCN